MVYAISTLHKWCAGGIHIHSQALVITSFMAKPINYYVTPASQLAISVSQVSLVSHVLGLIAGHLPLDFIITLLASHVFSDFVEKK